MIKNHLPDKSLQVIYTSVYSSGNGSLMTDLVDLLEEMLQVFDVLKEGLLYL